MAALHTSMCDDCQITVPAIGHLVEIAQVAIARQGRQGARMTGHDTTPVSWR